MSKARGSSNARQVRRGKVKFIFMKSLERFFKYRLTKRGLWIQDNNPSAKVLSKHEMNTIINNK